jgi:protein-S-isoprenylcysteine O-methyltransferase Ste14
MFKIIYWLGIVGQIIVRMPYQKKRTKDLKTEERRYTGTERLILVLLLVGGFVLPLIYSLTNWLDFANYSLPDWAGWLGVLMLAAALYVFARAHSDLSANWSPTLEIYKGHDLVTNGIYGVIRHPMYASQWLFSMAQALLLHNWIAGLAGLVLFVPFYFGRVKAEEQMMIETFGEKYRKYMEKTGGVLPRF